MKNLSKKILSILMILILTFNSYCGLFNSSNDTYAETTNNGININSEVKVNGVNIDTNSIINLKEGDKIEFNLNYEIDNELAKLKEGDKFEIKLPDVFKDVVINYNKNHFKDIEKTSDSTILICASDIETAISGFISIEATVNKVNYEVPGEVIIKFGDSEIKLDITSSPSEDKSLIDKMIGNSNKDYIINPDNKGEIINQEIPYKIVINEQEVKLENSKLIDEIPDGLELVEGSVVVKKIENGKEVIVNPDIVSNNPLEIHFGDIDKKHIVEYKLKVVEEKEEYINSVTINSANRESETDSITAIPKEDQTGNNDIVKTVKGSSVIIPNEDGSVINRVVRYEVTINDKKEFKENAVFIDKIPDGMELTEVVILKEKRGELIDVTSEFEFDINKKELVIDFGDINDKYIIQYKTKITEDKAEYKNDADLNWGVGNTAGSTVTTKPAEKIPGKKPLTKKINNKDQITVKPNDKFIGSVYNFTVIVNDKLENKSNAVVTDTIPKGMELVANSIMIKQDVGNNMYKDVTAKFKSKLKYDKNSYTIDFGDIKDRYRIMYKCKVVELVEDGYVNVAKLEFDNSKTEKADAVLKVDTEAVKPSEEDLLVQKTSSQDTVSNLDEEVKYKIAINSEYKHLKNLVLEDDIPKGLELLKEDFKVSEITSDSKVIDVTQKLLEDNKIIMEKDKLYIDFGDTYNKFIVEYKCKVTDLLTVYENTAKITAQDVERYSKNVLDYTLGAGGINATKTADKTSVDVNSNQDVVYTIKVWSWGIMPENFLKIEDTLDKRLVFKECIAPDYLDVKYDENTNKVSLTNIKEIPPLDKENAIEIKIKVSLENLKPGESIRNIAKVNNGNVSSAEVKKGYAFEGLKLDGENEDLALKGAKFKLYKVEEHKILNLIKISESLVEVEDGEIISDENGRISSLKEKNGEIYSIVKDKGIYVLKEVEAPDGYEISKEMAEGIRFEIKDEGKTLNIGNIYNYKEQEIPMDPELPQEPSKPELPGNPEEPNKPELPDNEGDNIEKPEVPGNPEEPNKPELPDNEGDNIEKPELPGNPEEPNKPEQPDNEGDNIEKPEVPDNEDDSQVDTGDIGISIYLGIIILAVLAIFKIRK